MCIRDSGYAAAVILVCQIAVNGMAVFYVVGYRRDVACRILYQQRLLLLGHQTVQFPACPEAVVGRLSLIHI